MSEQEQDKDIATELYHNYDETDEAKGENYENYCENTEDTGAYEYSADENDLAAILDQKDKDLRLAAELGKALLEQNAELERRIEQTAEEYNKKLEVSKVITQFLQCMHYITVCIKIEFMHTCQCTHVSMHSIFVH